MFVLTVHLEATVFSILVMVKKKLIVRLAQAQEYVYLFLFL